MRCKGFRYNPRNAGMCGCADPPSGLYDSTPPLPFFHCLNPVLRMAPECFHLRSSTSSSLASISYPLLRPLMTMPFAPRSTLQKRTSSLTPAMIGGLVAIGVLALLCAVGVGLAFHIHYCRKRDCSACSTIVCFTRSRRNHPMQGPYSQGLVELLTGTLIMNLLQLVTTVPRVCKHCRTHTL
jgi:hypothetical protein